MKKLTGIVLATTLLAALCACGAAEPAVQEAQAASAGAITSVAVEKAAAPEEIAAPAETDAPTVEAVEAAEPEPVVAPEPETDPLAAARNLVGESVELLYAAIGEPLSSDYAPSCLVDGDDGELHYTDFTVYTQRTAEGETVYYVE